MTCKRRRRNAPYYAVNSPAERAHNARRECILVRLGAHKVGGDSGTGYALNNLARPDTRLGRRIARALHGVGEGEMYRRERERRAEKAQKVPEANTSFGKHVEWLLVPSRKEAAVSRLLRLAIKAGCDKAVALLGQGRIKAGMKELVKAVG